MGVMFAGVMCDALMRLPRRRKRCGRWGFSLTLLYMVLFRTLTPCKGYCVVVCLIGIIMSVASLRHAIEGGCKHGFVCHGCVDFRSVALVPQICPKVFYH